MKINAKKQKSQDEAVLRNNVKNIQIKKCFQSVLLNVFLYFYFPPNILAIIHNT